MKQKLGLSLMCRFCARIAAGFVVLSFGMTAPAYAIPAEDRPPVQRNGVSVPTPPAAMGSETTPETAADTPTDAAKSKNSESSNDKALEDAKNKAFCVRTTDLGKQRLKDQKKECEAELEKKSTDTDKDKKELSEICRKVLSCVGLEPIKAPKEQPVSDTQASEPHTPTDQSEANLGLLSTKTGDMMGDVRIGGLAGGEGEDLLEHAVYKPGDGASQLSTAELTPKTTATPTETPINLPQSPLSEPVPAQRSVAEALRNNQVPATRNAVTNAAFILQFCREHSKPEAVCAETVRIASVESNFNPKASPQFSHPDCYDKINKRVIRKCSAFGYGQYIDDEWKTDCSRILGFSKQACMSPEIRGSGYYQLTVLMEENHESYVKYMNGKADNRGLDYSTWNYAIRHHSGGWGELAYVHKGIKYYNDVIGEAQKVYTDAATALNTDPAQIAQLSLTKLNNSIPSSGLSANTGGIRLGAYAQTPEQYYIEQLIASQGGGYGLQAAAYNPYGAAYGTPYALQPNGQFAPMAPQPVPGAFPDGGILEGKLPTIIVEEDENGEAQVVGLDSEAPRACGGQEVTAEKVNSGLLVKACIEG